MDEPVQAEESAPAEVPAEPSVVPEPTAEVSAAPVEVTPEPQAPEAPAAPATESAHPPESAPPEVQQSSLASAPSALRPTLDPVRGHEGQKQKVEQHLEKILAEAKKRKQITNRDVVKLLRVVDATANRYLNTLVVRSFLVREGKGRSIIYKIQ